MKKLIISLVLASTILLVNAQWQPTPNNPYKWYHIEKDTVIKGIQFNELHVCIYQYFERYQTFTVDSLGVPSNSPILTFVQFKEFASVEAAVKDFNNNQLNDYSQQFNTIPFGCEDGEIGVSQIINEYLSKRYNVPLNKITE